MKSEPASDGRRGEESPDCSWREDGASSGHGRFMSLIIRRRGVVAVIALLLTAAAGVAATRVRLNADFVTYLNAGNPMVRAYRYVGDVFGGNELGLALITAPDIYQPEVLSLISELTEVYRRTEGIEYATGLTNALDFTATDWGVEVGRLVRQDAMPTTEAELADLRRRVEANPRMAGNLVSDDGTLAAIQLRFAGGGQDRQASNFATARRVSAATQQLLDARGSPPGVTVYFGGLPFLMYNMTTLIAGNLATLVPLMVGFLGLVLYLGLRRWTGVVYPLAVVMVSSLLVLGVMGIFGLRMDLLSGLVPVVLIALGSADGIHYMKRYYELYGTGESASVAAARSYHEIRVPLILTTVTTMIGFGSLAISDFAVIRQFGLLTALGLFLALLVTLTLLPALAAFGAGSPRPRASRSSGAVMGRLARAIARAPGAILVAAVAAIVIAGSGMFLIVKSVDWTLCLKRGSPPHHAEMLLRQKLSGSLPIQLLVRGDLLDPATLMAMRRLERRMDALPLVGKSQSLASIIAEMNAAMNGRYAIPDTREGVANLWFLIENEKEIEQLVEPGATTEGLIQARIADWETDAIIQAVAGIDAGLTARNGRMVVIDRRSLDGGRDARLEQQRLTDLVLQVRWELAARGIEAPASLQHVAAEFLDWTPDPSQRLAIRDAVTGYLASPEAEATLDTRTAVRLASTLAGQADVWGVDAAVAEAAVHTVAVGLDEWAPPALGLSLARVSYDATGRQRVDDAIATLERAVPRLARDTVLRRNVRGTFWEAHSPLMILDGPPADGFGPDDAATVRVVTATIDRSGLASVLKQMEEELLPTQIESVLLTAVIVLILLSLMFRSAVAGGLLIVPLAATITLTFGVMGYLSIGLDSFTAMVASIAIGLGVDYAIHFTHRFRQELAATQGQFLDALTGTLRTSGVAILVNAASVGFGFLMLLAAGGQHIRRFGGLTSLAMLAAGLFTLLLLPALYFELRPRFLDTRERVRQRNAATTPSLTGPQSATSASGHVQT